MSSYFTTSSKSPEEIHRVSLLNKWAELYMSFSGLTEKGLRDIVKEKQIDKMSSEDLNNEILKLQFLIITTKEITSKDKAIKIILDSYENGLLSICGALYSEEDILRCKIALQYLKEHQ